MKTIASLEVDMAAELAARLKAEAIPFEIKTATGEGDMDYSDISVEDIHYDRACEVAEAWEAKRVADAQRSSRRYCPSCGSAQLEYCDESFGWSIWKCKDCGNTFSK